MSRPAARLDPGPVLVRVHGMRRSGNHAVIDWLRRNLPGETVFLNDCAPGDPFETYELMETPRGDRHGRAFRRTRWFAQFPDGREARSHVVSYEDAVPEDVGPPAGWAAPFRTVVIHRSFLNWLASFLALVAGRQRGTRWGVAHPREVGAFRETYRRLLGAAGTAISYDRWLGDPAYRAGRLAALGLAQSDPSTGATSDYGGGSSFEGGGDRRLRWARMAGDPHFDALAREAAADAPFIGALAPHYPQDAARLDRLAAGGSLRDEVTSWSN